MMKYFLLIVLLFLTCHISYAQNVGIGTGATSPTERLHVDENFRLDGAFMPGNNAGNNGEVLVSQGAGLPPIWSTPPSGGGPLSGKANYIVRWGSDGSALSYGLIQDDSTQVMITTQENALPSSDLNNFVSILAPGNGFNVQDNQRIALYTYSEDSISIFTETDFGEYSIFAINDATMPDQIEPVGVLGISGDLTHDSYAVGVKGVTSSNYDPAYGWSWGLDAASGMSGYNVGTGLAHGTQGISYSDSMFTAGVYGLTFPAISFIPNLFQYGVIGEAVLDIPLHGGVLGISGNQGPFYDQFNTHGTAGMAFGNVTGTCGVWGLAGGSGLDPDGNEDPTGVYGQIYGVYGSTFCTYNEAAGVYGDAIADDSTTSGVIYGVFGETNSNFLGAAGVRGVNNAPDGVGVSGKSLNGSGVYGLHESDDPNEFGYGVQGETFNSSLWSAGVYGLASNLAGVTYGVQGETFSLEADAAGVFGFASLDSDQPTWGVWGESNTVGSGAGVMGLAPLEGMNSGVIGITAGIQQGAVGVLGLSNSPDNTNALFGVHGKVSNDNASSAGIRGDDETGSGGGTAYAGWFEGKVNVTGNFDVGGTKNFRIDHPLDPENKYLRHICPESPEALNIYSGVITTDNNGEAIVQMPNYFEKLNKDFRYQLTCINQFADAIVATKINNNKFVIKTNKPNVEVSWVVYGVRNDPYIQTNPVIVEQEKEEYNKGKFLHPSAYQQPVEKGIGYLGKAKIDFMNKDYTPHERKISKSSSNKNQYTNSSNIRRSTLEKNKEYIELLRNRKNNIDLDNLSKQQKKRLEKSSSLLNR